MLRLPARAIQLVSLPAAVPRGRADVLDPHPAWLSRRGGEFRRKPAHGAGRPARTVAARSSSACRASGRSSTPASRPRCAKPAACARPCTNARMAALDGMAARPSRGPSGHFVERAALGRVVRAGAAGAVELRRPAPLPRGDLVGRADRARDPEVLPRPRRADPRSLRPDRSLAAPPPCNPSDASPVGTVGVAVCRRAR